MSGILNAIGKVFKSVVKVVKKIALPALAIGAVVLTGGAALGALPAVSSVIGGLGLSSGVSAALTSAVTSAATGAGIGALGAAVTGKNILSGAAAGAGVGALSGGLLGTGGLFGAKVASAAADPLSISGAAAANDAALSGLPGFGGAVGAGTGSVASTVAAQAAGAIPTIAPVAPAAAAAPGAAQIGAAATRGGLLGNLGRSLTSPTVIGQVIAGVGSGIGQATAVKDAAKAAQAERDAISSNYGVTNGTYSGGGLLRTSSLSDGSNRPTPTQRFDPRTYGGQYQYDQTQGRVVFVPNTPVAA
jgi:hypothetical protein